MVTGDPMKGSAPRRRTQIAAPSVIPAPPNLRPWQSSALQAWVAEGRRGIIAAATGTGKTTLALAAIAQFWEANTRVAIVVPSITLQSQWTAAICSSFGLAPTQVGTMGGKVSELRDGHGFVVCVINSARTGLPALTAGWKAERRRVMLIVDECHWAAARANSALFEGQFDATLGLSATPERSDDGLDDVLVPQLGPVVYRYALRQALDDGLLAPLTCWNVLFDLTAKEHAQLAPLQTKIEQIEGDLLRAFPELHDRIGLTRTAGMLQRCRDHRGASRLPDLYAQRAALLECSDGRRTLVGQLGQSGLLRQTKAIVFHERIEEARNTSQILERSGLHTAMELSSDGSDRRAEALRDFRSGSAQVLIAVRTLDEGVDLPDAKLAVIAAGSNSVRQRLQRIGRVVRPTGTAAHVITFVARGTNEELAMAINDGSLVGPTRVQLLNQLPTELNAR